MLNNDRVIKHTISMPRYSMAEVDFGADDLDRPCSTAIIKITWEGVARLITYG
ncbi:hypothetical protein [Bradyrhizobium glycinis]|uniref:hypothetical protein n=1 Tax=Bradyrhizobium glycinis TaxID=2751812 RepID=UPI0018D880E7|nr:hypothetical protein [Bradyrhizobium glycinis]MBH5367879.1 hypothetical protein [Bradyrhizobium glycinis]